MLKSTVDLVADDYSWDDCYIIDTFAGFCVAQVKMLVHKQLPQDYKTIREQYLNKFQGVVAKDKEPLLISMLTSIQ